MTIASQGNGDGLGRVSDSLAWPMDFAGADFGMRPAKGRKSSKFELFETAEDFSVVRTPTSSGVQLVVPA